MRTRSGKWTNGTMGGEKEGTLKVRERERESRYRLSAFGEFYKIHQEVRETEGTVALTVVVKETPLRDLFFFFVFFTTKLIRCSNKNRTH